MAKSRRTTIDTDSSRSRGRGDRLVDRFGSFVSRQARQRGLQLRRSGAAEIESGGDNFVEAFVFDKRSYQVDILYDDDEGVLLYECDCADFTLHGRACPHVWALLLAWETNEDIGPVPLDALQLKPDDDDVPEHESDDELDMRIETARQMREGLERETQSPPPASRSRKSPAWKGQLAKLRESMKPDYRDHDDRWPPGRQILYIIDAAKTLVGDGMVVQVANREKKQNGEWAKERTKQVPHRMIGKLPDDADNQVLSLLNGANDGTHGAYHYRYGNFTAPSSYVLLSPQQRMLTKLLCQTGRCVLRPEDSDELIPLTWDDGEDWCLSVAIGDDQDAGAYTLNGWLRRGDERMPLSDPLMLVSGGVLFTKGAAATFDDGGAFAWAPLLRHGEPIRVPAQHAQDLVDEVLSLPAVPRLELPESLRFERVAIEPQPQVQISAPDGRYSRTDRLRVRLSFNYGGKIVEQDDERSAVYEAERRRLLVRDAAAETEAEARLRELKLRDLPAYQQEDGYRLQLVPSRLPELVRTLHEAGWLVEAEGKLYRSAGAFKIEVTSGIDWFELHGEAQFDDQTVPLPHLLRALKRGEHMVRLGDGTLGLLPEEWLSKYGMLAGLGTDEKDHLRFTPSQVGILDALLAAQPEATCDKVFDRVRQRLRNFDGIEAKEAPKGFQGELRAYQRDGFGWFDFLSQFGFGGCLADDMGLGKTVQVLALLASRRRARKKDRAQRGPSLVVVPRSLVFNWIQEAQRFAPTLRFLDHTGPGRQRSTDHFAEHDVVITTYGTLRSDAARLKDVDFDYLILDESQAIKNASTAAAKAVRLLRGQHRLALTGTPVENHLGELWSLFEFLNPGMLGSASVFQKCTNGMRPVDEQTRAMLARALRPFILRRTKDQVAKDLPPKVEQTTFCDLSDKQRKYYDELKTYFRQSLLKKVERDGVNKAKIQVLEALLRLRQAACHPGLIDKSKVREPSAKLDLLMSQLREIQEEGHKALVFSQFTSFLAIVRDRLDRDGVVYEYLDGATRDRAARVERFQNDASCGLFLISLKAGGFGLNLTAADYVFLLDPWWNPAVELQAIDRTHRIGQTKHVFAHRLIARDTVEEKVIELQKSKRDLADSIINADNSLIRNLKREDLELLLS